MVRYADPSRCPDCSTTLPPHPTACPTCGLPLTGAVVHELFATLQAADALMARLRAAAVPGPVPPYDAATVAAPPRARLGAPSVPRILLGLGVLCLLVAAVTFLAVAWSWLGVGGRTVVLLLLTATSGGLSVWLSRRDLRLAGESLAVIGFGLLVLDVVGADNAGWFGSLTTGGLVSLAGIVAGVVGAGVAVLQRSAREPMVTPQVAAALGLWAAAAGFAFRTDHPEALAAIAAVALLGLAVAARALGIPLLAALLAFAGASWWLLLVLLGAERALDHRTVSELVGRADAWPLVVAIGLLVGAALLERHRAPLAALALGAAGVLTVLLLLVPASDNGGAQLGLVVAGLLLAAAAGALVRRPAVAPRRRAACGGARAGRVGARLAPGRCRRGRGRHVGRSGVDHAVDGTAGDPGLPRRSPPAGPRPGAAHRGPDARGPDLAAPPAAGAAPPPATWRGRSPRACSWRARSC